MTVNSRTCTRKTSPTRHRNRPRISRSTTIWRSRHEQQLLDWQGDTLLSRQRIRVTWAMGRQGVFVLFPIRPAAYERDTNVTFTTSNSLPASGVRPSCCKAKHPYTTLRLGHIFWWLSLRSGCIFMARLLAKRPLGQAQCRSWPPKRNHKL